MNVRFVGRRAGGRALVLLCVVAVAAVACSKDRGESVDRGASVDRAESVDGERMVNWTGPDVVRVAVPPQTDTSERYVQKGRRIAKGVCVFDRSGGQSGKAGTVTRDWLLAYEGRSCRALMARAAAP